MKFISHSLEQTEKFTSDFLKRIKSEKFSQAVVVGLKGQLGSGKTTFVQNVGKLLKVKSHITSPTFVIIKNYRLRGFTFTNLVHIDAYRLQKEKELEHLGWDNILGNRENLVFVEWPENIRKALPKNLIEINFEFTGQFKRVIEIRWPQKKIKKKIPKKD